MKKINVRINSCFYRYTVRTRFYETFTRLRVKLSKTLHTKRMLLRPCSGSPASPSARYCYHFYDNCRRMRTGRRRGVHVRCLRLAVAAVRVKLPVRYYNKWKLIPFIGSDDDDDGKTHVNMPSVVRTNPPRNRTRRADLTFLIFLLSPFPSLNPLPVYLNFDLSDSRTRRPICFVLGVGIFLTF